METPEARASVKSLESISRHKAVFEGEGDSKRQVNLMPPIESIITMHETYFSLPAGYYEIKILKLSKEYGHPAKELKLMEGSIRP
jgi:hypothetical protein